MKIVKFAIAGIVTGLLAAGCGEDETYFGYPPMSSNTTGGPAGSSSPTPTPSPTPGRPTFDSLVSKNVTLTDCQGQSHEIKVYASLRANEDGDGKSPGTAEGTIFSQIRLNSDGSYAAFSTNALNLLVPQTKRVGLRDSNVDTILLGRNTQSGSALDSLSKDSDGKWLGMYHLFECMALNPAGSAIAWTTGYQGLFVRVKNEDEVRSLKGIAPFQNGEFFYQKLSWDASGHLFLSMYRGSNTGRTLVYDLASNSMTPIAEGLLPSSKAVSADGKLLLLSRGQSDFKKKLVVLNRDTDEITEVEPEYGGHLDQDDDACITADGRFVFYSDTKDNARTWQIYRFNLASRQTEVVSTTEAGEPISFPAGHTSRAYADAPQASADGRYLAFLADGSNLPGYAENLTQGLFRKDLVTGELIKVNPNLPKRPVRFGDDGIEEFSLSESGQKIGFIINQSLLQGDDPNGQNAYLWDLAGGIHRLGDSQQGVTARAPGPSLLPDLSFDGSVVAYFSWCTEIFPMVRPELYDHEKNNAEFSPQSSCYVRNFRSGVHESLSRNASGQARAGVDDPPNGPKLSADGTKAVFVFRNQTAEGDITNSNPLDNTERVVLRDLTTGQNKQLNLVGSTEGEFSLQLAIDAAGTRVSWGGGSGRDGGYLVYIYNLLNDTIQGISAARLFYFGSFGGSNLFLSGDNTGIVGNEKRGYYRYAPETRAFELLPIQPQDQFFMGTSRASKDGSYLAYWPSATNLDKEADLYLYNLETGQTRKITESPPGQQLTRLDAKPADSSFYPYSEFELNRDFYGGDLAISDDGRFVAYVCTIDGLDPSDHNGRPDIYVYDRIRCLNALVSRNAALDSVNGNCLSVAISGDGKIISYSSDASDIIEDDDNLVGDIFVTLNPLFAEDQVTAKSSNLPDVFCRPVNPKRSAPQAPEVHEVADEARLPGVRRGLDHNGLHRALR